MQKTIVPLKITEASFERLHRLRDSFGMKTFEEFILSALDVFETLEMLNRDQYLTMVARDPAKQREKVIVFPRPKVKQ